MNLLEAEAKKKMIKEVSDKIRPAVSDMFATEVRKILAERIDAFHEGPGRLNDEPAELVEPDIVQPVDNPQEIKKALAEEILSLPEKEAYQKLKLSLAQGKIDESTFEELKGLLSASAAHESLICKKCGRNLEPSAKFCRFCGTKVM